MATLVCDICDGKLTMGAGGIAVCDDCGMEHSKERLQEKLRENKSAVETSESSATLMVELVKTEPEIEEPIASESVIAVPVISETDAKQVPEITVIESPTTENLLKRAFLFLEDGDFNTADTYFNRVLDINVENAKAYVGKVMVKLRVNKVENLSNSRIPLSENNNFQRAIRFADADYKRVLEKYISDQQANTISLESVVSKISEAVTVDDLRDVKKLFQSMPVSEETDRYIKALNKMIDNNHPALYSKALEYGSYGFNDKAVEIFVKISGYRDADALAEKYKHTSASPKQEPRANTAKKSFCPNCGTRIEAGLRFCPECGTRL